jgi:transcriptional regulator with XRE-family HTH domain
VIGTEGGITKLNAGACLYLKNLKNLTEYCPARSLLSGRVLMSDRDTFGPRLRSERERRGISIETIVAVTKVGADLWLGLERNDFSKWPSGIFARAFVRDYAKAVGLDADELVDEFCRLFPHGDRRAARIIKAQAELIGHSAGALDDASLAPRGGERRAAGRNQSAQARTWRIRLAPRSIAATIDVACTTALALIGPAVVGAGFWASAGVAAILYYTLSTILSGATLGTHAVDILRQRMPELFAVPDRRAHA